MCMHLFNVCMHAAGNISINNSSHVIGLLFEVCTPLCILSMHSRVISDVVKLHVHKCNGG